MNLDILAPDWAVIMLMAMLAAAAIQDVAQLKISNLLSGGVLVLAVIVMAVVGPEIRVWENLLVFVATLAVGTFLFSSGWLGGGDVKLLAATSLWYHLGGAFWFFVSVAIAGGLFALFLIIIRRLTWGDALRQRAPILRKGGGIPYGVAIAIGAAFSILVVRAAADDRPAPLDNWNVPQVER